MDESPPEFPRPPAQRPRGVNVLLYDPVGTHRQAIEEALSACAYRFELHEEFDSAWNAWRSGALQVLAVTAPAGLELCSKVAMERFPRTAEILALLDEADDGTINDFLAAGADDILLLPGGDRLLPARFRLAARRLQPIDGLPFHEQQDFFRLLVDTMNEGLGVRDTDGRIVYVNDHFCRMLGYRQTDVIGRRVSDFLDPDSARAFAEEMKRRPTTGSSSYELLMRTRDGRSILTIHSGQAIHGKEGTFQGSFAVVTNISERQQLLEKLLRSEDELHRSRQRFRELWDGVPVGAYRLSPDGRMTEVNKTLVEILGFKRGDELIGHDSGTFYVDQVDREAWRALIEKDGQVLGFETEIHRFDGTTLWVRSHCRALYDVRGEIVGYYGTIEDISGRRRAEEALKQSEDRFRSLVQHTSDLISILERDGKILYQSPASWPLTGFPAHKRLGKNFFELVHPSDRERLRRLMGQIAEQPGSQVQVEYRLAHRDQTWRVVESVMTNQLDNPALLGVIVNTRDVTDRKEAEDRLRHDALHDGLTGLPNRMLFMDRLGHALDRCRRGTADRTAVLFLDLDRFKAVNDSLGHAVGDLLMIETGKRLLGCLRPNDTLARLGGDEFGLLLEDVRDPSDPVRVAKRIQKVLAEPFDIAGREVYTSTSIGIALSHTATPSPEELLRDADTAMYRAKSEGRSGYAIFDAKMHAQVLAHLKLETALRRAVDQWQFEVLYQPIFDLASGRIAGFEALVRWLHPDRGLVLPNEFINLAEETGLINTLGNRVLAEACVQMKEWQDLFERRNDWFVAVNLSNRQFAQHDLPEQVERVLVESGLPGHSLVLELKETVVMDGDEMVHATLERLKSLGVSLSLDDFGTGHSSLAVLHRFPFDKVKIDQAFVRNVGEDGNDELVEGVMALCQWRRLETIAEGVETETERQKLLELGCSFAQGFLFATPSTASEAEELLRAKG